MTRRFLAFENAAKGMGSGGIEVLLNVAQQPIEPGELGNRNTASDLYKQSGLRELRQSGVEVVTRSS